MNFRRDLQFASRPGRAGPPASCTLGFPQFVWLVAAAVVLTSVTGRAGEPARTVSPSTNETAYVPLLSNDEAWRFLPKAQTGYGQPLPSWARALARSLSRTTAAMLHLDRIQRTRSPLGPLLRGKMRWVAAGANRCDYSLAYAEADLKRAGLDEAGLRSLRHNHADLPEPERAALSFARQMTVNAAEVTDAEVARLINWHGKPKVVAMVLLLAYANFQDRLLLTLGVPIEAGGPMPPLEIRFDPKADPPSIPPRHRPEGRPVPKEPERIDDPFWLSMEFGFLQQRLTEQRSRSSRIRVPTWDEVLRVMPPDYPKPKKPVRIQWSLVTMGYQPELAAAWSACTKAFGEEAKQDRVFEESLFWIVTRTIHCFY
jgi:alkylhydroperoxidase family enzyme